MFYYLFIKQTRELIQSPRALRCKVTTFIYIARVFYGNIHLQRHIFSFSPVFHNHNHLFINFFHCSVIHLQKNTYLCVDLYHYNETRLTIL